MYEYSDPRYESAARRWSESTTSDISTPYPTPGFTPQSENGDESDPGASFRYRADSHDTTSHHPGLGARQASFRPSTTRKTSSVSSGSSTTLAESSAAASRQRRASAATSEAATVASSRSTTATVPPTTTTTAAVKKTRSKTGCRNCRDRKKKCDEVKPECTACQKNNLACEYDPKTRWQPGGSKAGAAAAAAAASLPAAAVVAAQTGWIPLPIPPEIANLGPLTHGIESELDRQLLYYFRDRVAGALAFGAQGGSIALLNLLFPIASEHEVVMRSLQFLSASFRYAQRHHRFGETAENSDDEDGERWEVRRDHHESRAISLLRIQMAASVDAASIVPITAATLLLCLQEMYFGEALGGGATT